MNEELLRIRFQKHSHQQHLHLLLIYDDLLATMIRGLLRNAQLQTDVRNSEIFPGSWEFRLTGRKTSYHRDYGSLPSARSEYEVETSTRASANGVQAQHEVVAKNPVLGVGVLQVGEI